MKTLNYIPDCEYNMGNWKERHLEAIRAPFPEKEKPFIDILKGWLSYANKHEVRFGTNIGDDYHLGDAWFAVGMGLKRMLDGDLGTRLDCGTLCAIINDNLQEQGYDVDLEERIKND